MVSFDCFYFVLRTIEPTNFQVVTPIGGNKEHYKLFTAQIPNAIVNATPPNEKMRIGASPPSLFKKEKHVRQEFIIISLEI